MAEDFNSSKNSKSEQKSNCPILYKSPILTVLLLIICIYLIIKYKAYSADGIGSIVAATIAVIGVYFTVMEYKEKTYNEIVTRERIEKENSICEKICNFGTFLCYFILVLLLISLSLGLLYYIGFIIYDKTGSTNLPEGAGIVLAAVISVIGVLIGYFFNKRQTYKEIVTRERIEWLHKMQEALAEFLSITSNPKVKNGLKDKKDRARELYYLIISNLNVKEDKVKKNEREAVEFLYNYAKSKGLDVELNFYRKIKSAENKDANGSISPEEIEKEIDKLKEEIKALEKEKQKLKNRNESSDNKEEVESLTRLKRRKIISQYTEIFNETWNRIKNEAD